MPYAMTRGERSRIMAAVKSKDTRPEMVVRRLVHTMGYRYRLHVRSLPGTPDLVFPRLRSVILVHGCFWHAHQCQRGRRMPATNREYWLRKRRRNAARDRRTSKTLIAMGWRVLTIWECQLKDAANLRRRLARFLEGTIRRNHRRAS